MGEQEQVFRSLLEQASVSSKAELRRSRPPTGFGLFAKEGLKERDVILRVPLDLCIVEPRSLPDHVVRSTPGGVPDSFTWDVRLAVKLLEASMGRWNEFWAKYGRLFPTPQQMAQPSLLHQTLLAELQHTAVLLAAQAQQQRLRSLFPELMPAEDAPFDSFPSQLQWTFALTRSRAFSAGDEHFALVPFLDLANLSNEPNADFEFVPAEKCFYLRAARAIPPGQEVVLPANNLDNQKTFARFGWVEPGGNPFDELPGIAGPAAGQQAPAALTLSRKRLWESLKAQGVDANDLFSLSPYLRAILRSLPLADDSPLAPLQEVQAAAQLRASLQEVQHSDFKTSVQDDVQLVHQIKQGNVDADPRMLAVLLYRVERKTLIGSAVTLLTEYEQFLQRTARALT